MTYTVDGVVMSPLEYIAHLHAALDALRADVREWACVDCSTVYPGPPQQGFACVMCPKCNGTTAPRGTIERRKLEAEIAELRSPLPDQDEPDLSTRQGKLRALADRIDHERLWRTAGMYRDDWTDDQRARYEAGVMLRRYAEILQPGRWLVIPPTGPMQFGAETLERVTEMALRHYATIGGPL